MDIAAWKPELDIGADTRPPVEWKTRLIFDRLLAWHVDFSGEEDVHDAPRMAGEGGNRREACEGFEELTPGRWTVKNSGTSQTLSAKKATQPRGGPFPRKLSEERSYSEWPERESNPRHADLQGVSCRSLEYFLRTFKTSPVTIYALN